MRLDKALTNSEAKDFHNRYIKKYAVPYYIFYENFSKYLLDQEIQPSPGLNRVIRNEIDSNKSHVIDAYEINEFFNQW